MRSGRNLHDPEHLSAELYLRPIGMVFDHRQAEAAPIKLNRAIHIVHVDADLKVHNASFAIAYTCTRTFSRRSRISFSFCPTSPVKIICDVPQSFARRFSSTMHSSGVPIRIIGDASSSSVLRVASRDSERIVAKTKLLMRTASGLRPSRFASSRTKLTFSRNDLSVVRFTTAIEMCPRLPASGIMLM